MPNRKWTRERLDGLQALLDQGKTPLECAVVMSRLYGIQATASTIRRTILGHGLTYEKPRAPSYRECDWQPVPEADEPAAEPACPLKGRVDYAPDNEEPGDWKGSYRPIAMGMVMRRKGEF